MSQIQQFYAGQNIFITGSTGFLGKVLLEKLLHFCPDIETIYLLVRAKKGKSAQERIDALLVDPVFDNLRSDHPDFSKKVVGLTGDIAQDELGLSTTDYERLVDEVSVIFHLAATVRFDETLDKAVAVNVNSTKSIMDIAKACKNLKAGIYVSTAYSHCVRKSISEELYPPPLSWAEVNKLVEDVGKDKLSRNDVKNSTESLTGKWPNTYSFTKAIAEGVVAEFAEEMPFAIFRPSIVVTSYTEPVPGWLSGPIGLPGFICALGLGVLHVARTDMDLKIDMVPVDYVCNALISSAWEIGTTQSRHLEEIPVYNYVSGNQNPTTWMQLTARLDIYGHAYPSNSAVYYPSGFWTKSALVYSFLHFWLHSIPALIVDNVARLFGKNLGNSQWAPLFSLIVNNDGKGQKNVCVTSYGSESNSFRLYKIARKLGNASSLLSYFTTQEWDFEDQRVQNLWKRMGTLDKRTFPFNIRNLDWDEHTMHMIRGLRKYIIGESEDNLEQARWRQFYLYIVHTIVRLAFGFSILWMIWKLFKGPSLTISMELHAA